MLHPRFVSAMTHVRLTGNEFIVAARGDHAPLTDLRLRRDESSRQMLILNMRIWSETSPETFRELQESVRDAAVRDSPAYDILCVAGEATPTRLERQMDQCSTSGESAYELLLKYVNAFGAWDEAERVARQYTRIAKPHADRLDGLTSGLAGVVLGLAGDSDSSDRLFERAVSALRDSAECFFAYLRWASITAKRHGDLHRAERLIERALAQRTTTGHGPDGLLEHGLALNFRALLRLRKGQLDVSRRLVHEAIVSLRGAFAAADETCGHAEETARYVWMAELNAAQLDVLEGDYRHAMQRLGVLEDFAKRHDRGALHTTLSALAFLHLGQGRPADAVPLLRRSLDLVGDEYDPAVVKQVRKMLYRSYVELDDARSANEVARLSPYFWLGNVREPANVG